jgi:uncharacterized protein YdaU (DUF1376 family)
MAEFPALPFFVDAYSLDCGHLSDAEHGRYLLILIAMWSAPMKRLPNDPVWLARRFRRTLEEAHRDIIPLLREFCDTDGNWWTQGRILREWEYLKQKSEKQSLRAKKRWSSNVHKKSLKTNDIADARRGIDPAYARNMHVASTTKTVPDKSLFDNDKDACHGNAPYPTLKDAGKSSKPDGLQREEKRESEGRTKPEETEEASYFRRGKSILGASAGGLLSRLLKVKNGNVALARSLLELAATKQDAREYIGRVIAGPANINDPMGAWA